MIYRDKYGVLAYVAIIGMFTSTLGFLFAFVIGAEDGQLPLRIFGWVFLIAGIGCIISIKRIAASFYKNLGLPVLWITKDQVVVNGGIGSNPTIYRRHQIQKIIVTATLFSEDIDGPTKFQNRVVILFNPASIDNNTFSKITGQRSTAKDGTVYSELPFPDNLTIQQVETAILNACPLAKVETSNELRLR